MKSRFRKELSILSLTLMLAISGCSNKGGYEANKTESVVETTDETKIIKTDDLTFINDYEEYKQYLSNLNPSYKLLRETIKSNKNIPDEYESVLLQIVDIFERNDIKTEKLAIFYENLSKLVIKTDHEIKQGEGTKVAAFFTVDPYEPSITVDGDHVDFYTFLHEVLHSSSELLLDVDGKLIYISSTGINITEVNNKEYIEQYGLGYKEGHTEYLSNLLYNSSSHLFTSSKNYDNACDIIDFLHDTLELTINDSFLMNVDDFKDTLSDMGINDDEIDDLIKKLDTQINDKSYDGFKTRETFYYNYIPALVNKYIKDGLTSKEIYEKIGTSLKNSVIESRHDISSIYYYEMSLNEQKELFDNIDEIIKEILDQQNIKTYSIYDYIGHEFLIYYSLYGEEESLNYANLYLAFNWDDTASINSNIMLYEDNGELCICNYIKNEDGSYTCFDANGEVKNLTVGLDLKRLTEEEIVTSYQGHLRYYYYQEQIIYYLEDIRSRYDKTAILESDERYLYIADGRLTFANITTNELGEEITYHISKNKVYILPENAYKVGTFKELSENNVLYINDEGNISINSKNLDNYLESIKGKTR